MIITKADIQNYLRRYNYQYHNYTLTTNELNTYLVYKWLEQNLVELSRNEFDTLKDKIIIK